MKTLLICITVLAVSCQQQKHSRLSNNVQDLPSEIYEQKRQEFKNKFGFQIVRYFNAHYADVSIGIDSLTKYFAAHKVSQQNFSWIEKISISADTVYSVVPHELSFGSLSSVSQGSTELLDAMTKSQKFFEKRDAAVKDLQSKISGLKLSIDGVVSEEDLIDIVERAKAQLPTVDFAKYPAISELDLRRDTSSILWYNGGSRITFVLGSKPDPSKMDSMFREMNDLIVNVHSYEKKISDATGLEVKIRHSSIYSADSTDHLTKFFRERMEWLLKHVNDFKGSPFIKKMIITNDESQPKYIEPDTINAGLGFFQDQSRAPFMAAMFKQKSQIKIQVKPSDTQADQYVLQFAVPKYTKSLLLCSGQCYGYEDTRNAFELKKSAETPRYDIWETTGSFSEKADFHVKSQYVDQSQWYVDRLFTILN